MAPPFYRDDSPNRWQPPRRLVPRPAPLNSNTHYDRHGGSRVPPAGRWSHMPPPPPPQYQNAYRYSVSNEHHYQQSRHHQQNHRGWRGSPSPNRSFPHHCGNTNGKSSSDRRSQGNPIPVPLSREHGQNSYDNDRKRRATMAPPARGGQLSINGKRAKIEHCSEPQGILDNIQNNTSNSNAAGSPTREFHNQGNGSLAGVEQRIAVNNCGHTRRKVEHAEASRYTNSNRNSSSCKSSSVRAGSDHGAGSCAATETKQSSTNNNNGQIRVKVEHTLAIENNSSGSCPRTVHEAGSCATSTEQRSTNNDGGDNRVNVENTGAALDNAVNASNNNRSFRDSAAVPARRGHIQGSGAGAIIATNQSSNNQDNRNVVKVEHPDREEASTLLETTTTTTSNNVKTETTNNIVGARMCHVIDLTLDDMDDDNGVGGGEQKENETHIIFAIDFSSSMKKCDVQSQNKKGKKIKISRWSAVFNCIDGFLEEQLQQEKSDKVVVSVLVFNQTAETLLERMPLVGDGQKVRKALQAAEKKHKPNGGTCFAAGLERAKSLASADKSSSDSNVALVFLSDGRPGDLCPKPPKNSSIPMQRTFSHHYQCYPAAGVHIEQMKQELNGSNDTVGGTLDLHFVCLYPEGKPWLEYLANRYEGKFHQPNLALNDEDDDTARNITQGVVQPASRNVQGKEFAADYGSDEEDEIIAIKFKSQNTLARENYNRALAAGNVHSLTTTTSMRSTFSSISSSVTAMRSANGKTLPERRVKLANQSPMITFEATRMVLSGCYQKFTVAPGETANARKVQLSMHPFAQGGLRNVYRMHQQDEPPQVGKESRHQTAYVERLKFHVETSKCQAHAATYAVAFNNAVSEVRRTIELPAGALDMFGNWSLITVLRAEVYRLNDARVKGSFRYLAVEAELKGDYKKWNSNNGYVNPLDCKECQIAQAFTHFTYENSKEQEMVVDIQGSGFTYTDPQLHSLTQEFGRADRGKKGFKDFFKTHKCNFLCRALDLKDRSIPATGPSGNRIVKLEKK